MSKSSHTAVLDQQGAVIAIDDEWAAFALENGGDAERTGVGMSYLDICDSDGDSRSVAVAAAIRAAISGSIPDPVTIACHPPESVSWYRVSVAPTLPTEQGAVTVTLERQTRPSTMDEPPHGPTQDNLMGAKCQAAVRTSHGETMVLHQGCPGWWGDRGGDTGWSCACPCHEERFGWPAWQEHNQS